MKVLVIGFQRSGTTLLRRLVQHHPNVRHVFHEHFFLARFSTRKRLAVFLRTKRVSIDKDNWGEKVPFYAGSIRKKLKLVQYCEMWNTYFPKDSKIIHIVRHPVDVSLSVLKKYKVKSLQIPLQKYVKLVPRLIKGLNDFDNLLTIKFEDLVIKPEETLTRVFSFCDLDSDPKTVSQVIREMSKNKSPKYQQINESRAFAFKERGVKVNFDLTETTELLNSIGGVEY